MTSSVRFRDTEPNLESVQQTKSIQLVIETAKTILLYIALLLQSGRESGLRSRKVSVRIRGRAPNIAVTGGVQ